MPEYITKGRHEAYTPAYGDEKAKLRITYQDGRYHDLKGDEALYNYSGPEGEAARKANPALAAKYKVSGPADERQFLGYKLGKGLREYMLDPSSMHNKVLSTGPWAAGAAGAGLGWLGGMLANWIADAGADAGLMHSRGIDYGLLGAGLGAAGAAGLGYLRKNASVKSAAMFTDPRNAILEALAGASDASASDKVRLAAAVRNLDYTEAAKLSKKVRSALGFGVGALIARELGMSLGGMLMGGILGVLGAGAIHSYMNQQNQHLFL